MADAEVRELRGALADATKVQLRATQAVLAERERELLDLKGPCSCRDCRLHHAHAGPCDIPHEAAEGGA